MGGGGGGVNIKVGGRSRERTESCIVVLPYREPEGINSFNPGQPIPLQTTPCFHVGRDCPLYQSFLYLRFYTGFYSFFCVVPKVKTKIRGLEMYISIIITYILNFVKIRAQIKKKILLSNIWLNYYYYM